MLLATDGAGPEILAKHSGSPVGANGVALAHLEQEAKYGTGFRLPRAPGLIRDPALPIAIRVEAAKERIEHDLLKRMAHLAANHRPNPPRQENIS